jgi:mRNA interferase MazF
MTTSCPLRGEVYWASPPGLSRKPYVVVSNNRRNRLLPTVVVARVTTTPRPLAESIVHTQEADAPIVGWVLCDELTTMRKKELLERLGALSPLTMFKVAQGLRVALGLA